MKVSEREFFDYSLASQVSFIAADQQSSDEFSKTLEKSVKVEEKPVDDVTLPEDTYERSETTDTTRQEDEQVRNSKKESAPEEKVGSENKTEVKEDSTSAEKDTVTEKDQSADKEGKGDTEKAVQKPDSDKEINNKETIKKADKKDAEVVNLKVDDQKETVVIQDKKAEDVPVKSKSVSDDQSKVKKSVENDKIFAEEMEAVDGEEGEHSAVLNNKSAENSELITSETDKKQVNTATKKTDKLNNDIQITFADSKSEVVEQKEAVNRVQSAGKVLEQYQEFREKILKNIENGVKIAMNRPEGQISIKLQPPELGRMDIQLSVKEGGVSAEILTENHAVKEVILTNLEQLKSNMDNANLSLNNVDVSTGDLNRFTDQKLGQGEGQAGRSNGKKGNGGGGIDSPENDNQIVNSAPVTQFLGRSLNLLI